MSSVFPVAAAALILCLMTVALPGAQTVTQRALADAATYLSTLRARLPGVVFEERYLQQTTSRLGEGATRSRELLSDVGADGRRTMGLGGVSRRLSSGW